MGAGRPRRPYDQLVRALTDEDLSEYKRDGLIGPFPLADDRDRRELIRDARVADRRASWYRGLLAFDSSVLQLGQRPDLVAAVARLVSPDLLLWGAELAQRVPGHGHYWHNDVEALNGHTLNAWVGLAHVGPDTPFLFVPGSHRYGALPQDLVPGQPELRDDDVLLDLARRYDPEAVVARVVVDPGEVLLFHGSVWHGTRNDATRMRKALVFQYCATTTRARRPLTYQTPVQWHPDPCPCVLVAGEDHAHCNAVADPVPPTLGARFGGLLSAVDELARDAYRRVKYR